MTNEEKIKMMDLKEIDKFAKKLAYSHDCCVFDHKKCKAECGKGFIEWLKKEVE